WKVLRVGTPRFKLMLLMVICGKYCLYPARGTMPSVPSPVIKPREERSAKLPAGLSRCSTVRKKLNRASFTAVVPKVFELLITNCCAREGVVVGKPGTLGKEVGSALSSLALSR